MADELSLVNSSVVMPAMTGNEALAVWSQYQDLITKVCTDEDYQQIQDKKFRKKSGWRKIATFFNLSIEIVEERKEQIGKTLIWHFTVKAVAPNGRFATGVGSCDAYEKAVLKNGVYMAKGQVTKWGKADSGKSFPLEWAWTEATPNSLHNIRSTAETRATNRAISNLVGGGEVSAEEMVDDGSEHQSQATKPVTRRQAAPKHPKPTYGAKSEPVEPVTEKQLGTIYTLVEETGVDMDGIVEKATANCKVDDFEAITSTEANKIIAWLKKKAAEQKADEMIDGYEENKPQETGEGNLPF